MTFAPSGSRVSLHLAVGGDHCPVARRVPESLEAGADGRVRSTALADEVRRDEFHLPPSHLSGRSPVEVDLHLLTACTAKLLQVFDELQFVIHGAQAQSKLGDQVVTIDQDWHRI